MSVLKCLKLKRCGPLEDVDILVQGIESFLYGSEKFAFDQIKISGCTFLKNLELLSVTITDKLIENLGLSGLMFLESLSFHSCKFKMINSFKLYFENLKSLEFWCCKYLVSPVFGNLEIGSPNLVSFNYTGDLMPFIPVSVISSSTHISGEIEIFYYDVTRKFQLQKDLRDFLHLFGHFNELFLSGGFTVVNIYT